MLAALIFLAWPLVLFVMKDRPSDIGQNPDGAVEPPAEAKIQSRRERKRGACRGRAGFYGARLPFRHHTNARPLPINRKAEGSGTVPPPPLVPSN